MSEPQRVEYARQRPPSGGSESWLLSLVSAGLFLYVGFGLGLVGISQSELYNVSVAVLVWGARAVGIGILVATAMLHLRVPAANVLDFGLGLLATLLCLGVGAIWLAFSDTEGVLLMLFGLLNASATVAAWRRWRGGRVAMAVPTGIGERRDGAGEP